MEQQLQANCIRIKVLEQENMVLQRSLEKLRDRAQNNASRVRQMKLNNEYINLLLNSFYYSLLSTEWPTSADLESTQHSSRKTTRPIVRLFSLD